MSHFVAEGDAPVVRRRGCMSRKLWACRETRIITEKAEANQWQQQFNPNQRSKKTSRAKRLTRSGLFGIRSRKLGRRFPMTNGNRCPKILPSTINRIFMALRLNRNERTLRRCRSLDRAVSSARPSWAKALVVSQSIGNRRIVTSQAVLTEFLNHFAAFGAQFREKAVQVVQSLRQSPQVEIIEQSPARFEAALDLYAKRPDKAWDRQIVTPFCSCSRGESPKFWLTTNILCRPDLSRCCDFKRPVVPSAAAPMQFYWRII